ncbi:hypothetical protein LINPERHAP1_LOCUS25709 [Linum perenne]
MLTCSDPNLQRRNQFPQRARRRRQSRSPCKNQEQYPS